MVKKKLPLRFYGRSTITSLTNDVLISIRSTSRGSIKDAVVKRVLDAAWFSVKHRLLITGKVRVPKLGDFEIDRDHSGRPTVRYYPDPILIAEITASLVARSPSLHIDSDSAE